MAKRVLLAEDEPNIVESLTFLLERAGFDVAVETDGRKALDTALATVPDVLVLDVMLPGLDGLRGAAPEYGRTPGPTRSLPVLDAYGQGAA